MRLIDADELLKPVGFTFSTKSAFSENLLKLAPIFSM